MFKIAISAIILSSSVFAAEAVKAPVAAPVAAAKEVKAAAPVAAKAAPAKEVKAAPAAEAAKSAAPVAAKK
jgi:hypothetical protein